MRQRIARGAALVTGLALSANLARPVAGQDPPPGADPHAVDPRAHEAPAKVPVRTAGRQVHEIVASADAGRIAASTGERLLVWDVESPKPVLVLDRYDERVFEERVFGFRGIGLSADGTWVLSLETAEGVDSGEVAHVWQVMKPVAHTSFDARFPVEDGGTYSSRLIDATFESPGGGLLLFRRGLDFSVAQQVPCPNGIELREPAVRVRFPDPRKSVVPVRLQFANRISFAPDGSYVAIADSNSLHLLAWPSLEERWQAARPKLYGFRPWVAADGKVILLDTQRTVREGGMRTAAVYESRVVAFNLRGEFLWERPKAEILAVSRARDRAEALLSTPSPELVDARTGKKIASFPPASSGTLTAAVFSPDGRFLWAAHRDVGEIRRHAVPEPPPPPDAPK